MALLYGYWMTQRNNIKRHITTNHVLAVLTLLIVVLILTFDSDFYNFYFAIPDDIHSLFFSIGSTIGAMLAIVLAFSSQLATRVSEAVPTRFFVAFGRDRLLDFAFVSIGIMAVVEFILGLIVKDLQQNPESIYIKIGLSLLVVSVMMLFFSYTRLVKLMSINSVIIRTAKQQKKTIDKMSSYARLISWIGTLGKNAPLNIRYELENDVYQNQLKRDVERLSGMVEGSLEFYYSYHRRQDIYAAESFLHIGFSLIVGYLLSRKDNSVLTRSVTNILSRQSQTGGFITDNIQILDPVWRESLKNNEVSVVRSYVRDVLTLNLASLEVVHINAQGDNPAFFSSFHYLRTLIEQSIKADNEDALFEFPSALRQIGAAGYTKQLTFDAVRYSLDEIEGIVRATFNKSNLNSVQHIAIKNTLDFASWLLYQDDLSSDRVKRLSEVVAFVSYMYALDKSNPLTDVETGAFALNVINIAGSKISDEDVDASIQPLINASVVILKAVDKLAPIANGNRYETQNFNYAFDALSNDFAKALKTTGLSERTTLRIQEQLIKIVEVPTKLPKINSISSADDIDDYIDKLISAAMNLIEHNKNDLAQNLYLNMFEYLCQMNAELINGSVSIDILRLVNKIKLIGAYANKSGDTVLADKIRFDLVQFQDNYMSMYFSDGIDPRVSYMPPPDMLTRSFARNLVDSRSGLPLPMQDAIANFFARATTDDLRSYEEQIGFNQPINNARASQ